MRGDKERLLDILEAIEKITERLPANENQAFSQDELLQVWALHYIQIIGEAASRLSEAIKSMHPEVPWIDIVAMRNMLVHQYFQADLDQVWYTIVHDLPPLRTIIENELTKLGESQ